MIPLNQTELYWNMAAHSLYGDVDEIIHLFNSNLVVSDLTNARLGINDDDDDWESWSASQGDELLKVLRAMKTCKNLQHLNLSGNYIVQKTIVSQLPALLCPFSKLTFLSLAEALPHGRHLLRYVGKSLEVLPRLTYLDLSKNSLNADMFIQLTSGLNKLLSLEKLDLSKNNLSSTFVLEEDHKGGAEEETIEILNWVCNFIHGTPSLENVDLTGNGFDQIFFEWDEVAENAEITKNELKMVLKKIEIKDDW